MRVAGPVAQALVETQVGEYHMQAGGGRGPTRLMADPELKYWMYQMCMHTTLAASAALRDACDSWNARTHPAESRDYAVRALAHLRNPAGRAGCSASLLCDVSLSSPTCSGVRNVRVVHPLDTVLLFLRL